MELTPIHNAQEAVKHLEKEIGRAQEFVLSIEAVFLSPKLIQAMRAEGIAQLQGDEGSFTFAGYPVRLSCLCGVAVRSWR